MIILFGMRTINRAMCVVLDSIVCGRCNNHVQRTILRSQDWFTLFFIPVFPLSKKCYYQVCPVCGALYEITKEQAEDFIARYPETAQQQN